MTSKHRPVEPWDEPEMKAWLEDARVNLIPLLQKTEASVFEARTTTDLKYAIELGLSILMNKPILAVVLDDRQAPPKLLEIADHVLHMKAREMGTPAGERKFQAAVEEMMAKVEGEG